MRSRAYLFCYALLWIGCSGPEKGKPCYLGCSDGYYCDVTLYAAGTCQLLEEVGESCEWNTCQPDLACVYGNGERLCFEKGAMLNEACGDEVLALCSSGLYCDESTSLCAESPELSVQDMTPDLPLDQESDGVLEVDMMVVDSRPDEVMDVPSDAPSNVSSDEAQDSVADGSLSDMRPDSDM